MANLERSLREAKPVEGSSLVFALQGHPGVGKTTLCADLARRLASRFEFRDGIFWVTLGENPANLLGLVGGLIQELGDRTYRALELQTAAGHLKSQFRTKRALIIIDDAWNVEHVRPLLADGPYCRILLTARDSRILRILNAKIFRVEIMTPEEAVAMLAAQRDPAFTEEERSNARELAELLGYLPLALQIARMELATGTGWGQLLAELKEERGRIEALEPERIEELDEETRRTRSIRACFQVSIRQLDARTAEAFAWLGVLRPGVVLASPWLTILWAVDEDTAAQSLRYLAEKSLLIPVSQDGLLRYRLHDLMHDFARELVIRPAASEGGAGLGLKWADAQTNFLDRYRSNAKQFKPSWFDVADDGYIYINLPWHLEQANRTAELFDLVESPAFRGGRLWYEGCDREGNLAAFAVSVQETRRLAEEEFRKRGNPRAWGRVVRAIFLLTSVNSIAAMPPELSVALVRSGVWKLEHALSYVRRQADPDKRVRDMTDLIGAFSDRIGDDLYFEVLEDIKRLSAYSYYLRVLQLARHIKGHPTVAAAILKQIDGRVIEPDWIRLVSKLLPIVSPDEAARFAERDRRFIDDDRSYRAWAPAITLQYVNPPMRQSAFEFAKKIRYHSHRALALANLAWRAEPGERDDLVRAALKTFLLDRNVFDWSELFEELQPILETDTAWAKEALQCALQVYERHRSGEDSVEYLMERVLVLLAKAVARDPELVDRVLEVTRSFEDMNVRTRVLAEIALHVPEPRRSAIVAEAESLLSGSGIGGNERGVAMIRLSRLRPEGESRKLLMEARAYYSTIGDGASYRAAFLGMLESVVPKDRRAVAFRAAQIEDSPEAPLPISAPAARLLQVADHSKTDQAVRQARLFLSLAELFPEEHDDLYQKGLDALEGATHSQREEVMKAFTVTPAGTVAPVIDEPPADLVKAWSEATAIADVHDRLMAMIRLLPHLEAERRPKLMLDIIRASASIQDEDYEADVLVTLSKTVSLTPQAYDQILARARAMRDRPDAAATLAYLVPHAPESDRSAIFREALAAAQETKHQRGWQVRFLFLIAVPNCPESEMFDLLIWGLMTVLNDESMPDSSALKKIVERMQIYPKEQVAPVLSAALDLLSGKARTHLHTFLSAAHPLVAKCCGPDALAETLWATTDVMQYFP